MTGRPGLVFGLVLALGGSSGLSAQDDVVGLGDGGLDPRPAHDHASRGVRMTGVQAQLRWRARSPG